MINLIEMRWTRVPKLTFANDRLPERSCVPQAQGEVLRVLSIDAKDSVDLE